MELTTLAMNEFISMLPTRRTLKGREVLKTETPLGRGGTQELMDAGLIDFRGDDGLFTSYYLTVDGMKLAVVAVNEVKPVLKMHVHKGPYNGRTARCVTRHLDKRRDGLRITTFCFDDESIVKVQLIRGDGFRNRDGKFEVLASECAPFEHVDTVVGRMQLRAAIL